MAKTAEQKAEMKAQKQERELIQAELQIKLAEIQISVDRLYSNWIEESHRIGRLCKELLDNPERYGIRYATEIARAISREGKSFHHESHYITQCYRLVSLFSEQEIATIRMIKNKDTKLKVSWSHIQVVMRQAVPQNKRIPLLRYAIKENLDANQLSIKVRSEYPTERAIPAPMGRLHVKYTPGEPMLLNMKSHINSIVKRFNRAWTPDDLMETSSLLDSGELNYEQFVEIEQLLAELLNGAQQVYGFMKGRRQAFDKKHKSEEAVTKK